MKRLKNYSYNFTSQWGEDGIIEELFRRIGEKSRICVEFGAYDGPYLSNTCRLWLTEGWRALLIEGDPEKAKSLREYAKSFPLVTAIEAYVRSEGPDNIDGIIERTMGSAQIDLMSIDIDSDDSYIFESIQKYIPRVVIVEYNPTVPPHIDIVQKEGEYFGASALHITIVAEKKGYRLVEMTGTNCFFVRNDEYYKIYDRPYSLSELFSAEFLTYVITSQSSYSFLTRKPAYLSKESSIVPSQLVSDIPLIPIGNILPQKQPRMFQKLKRLILRFQEKKYNVLFPFAPLPPEDLQKKYAATLITEIASLESPRESVLATDWLKNRAELITRIVSHNPVRFMDWDVIRGTMFNTPPKSELFALQSSILWEKHVELLHESQVGNPRHYPAYPRSSGNLIHQAYNLLQLMNAFSIDITEIRSVVEFGGGYGCMCRLFYQAGFVGGYGIFDIPEFSALQRYFLSMTEVYAAHKINLVSGQDEPVARAWKNPDLCIMLWSLSESPFNVREKFMKSIGKPNYFLIAYQRNFGDIDNSLYFREFKKKYWDYGWVEYEIPHHPLNYYLLGTKAKP